MQDLSRKINFNYKTMQFENITLEQVKIWEVIYDEVDVPKEIKYNMVQWLDKVKGTKKANKKNWKTFICNWLKRSQANALGML